MNPCAGRLVYTLVPMSAAEADAFNIPATDRGLYIRLDPANTNIAACAGEATWLKLIGVATNNGTKQYPSGDTIQAVAPGSPPNAWAALCEHTVPRAPRSMLSEAQLLDLFPFGRTTLFSLIKAGGFPRGTYVSPNRRAWFADEIAHWQDALSQGNPYFNPTRGRGRGRHPRNAVT